MGSGSTVRATTQCREVSVSSTHDMASDSPHGLTLLAAMRNPRPSAASSDVVSAKKATTAAQEIRDSCRTK